MVAEVASICLETIFWDYWCQRKTRER